MALWLATLAFAAILAALPPPLKTSPIPSPERITVKVPMKDGVRLSTYVFKPPGSARMPTILVRTPYGKGVDLIPNYRAFVDRGYVVVVQDVRGRYESEGTFRPMIQEGSDGNDTLNWIARQQWSTAKWECWVGPTSGSCNGKPHSRATLT